MNAENKILARVKKMLAIANDDRAPQAERDTAMKMAYNLLAKYNLSIADLPADQNDEARESQSVVISADKWARSLSSSMAKLFFCKYWFERTGVSGKDGHRFVGRQSNVLTAMHMSEYLIKSLKKEATKRYKSPTSPEGRSFCVGATTVIRNRVDEMLAKGSEDESGKEIGNALVLLKLHDSEKEANDRYADEVLGIKLKVTIRADNSLRAGAMHAGRDFGSKVSLATQIGGSTPKRKALS